MSVDRRLTLPAEEFIRQRKESLVGRRFTMKDVGRAGFLTWVCEAATLWQQSDHPKKVAVLMRLRLAEVTGERFHGKGVGATEGSIEYRLGYYIVARNGQWWWGQYALMIPTNDLAPLLQKARDEGTLVDDVVVKAQQ
jgi:hypothetical protein